MIKKILRRIKYGTTARIDMFRMHRQWRAIQARAYSPRKITSVRKLLIIPSDPWTLVGAKGDEAMMEAAVEMGLTEEQGKTLALATFQGASALALASPETPAVLRERVTSKGGTTHAAITSLEADGVKAAFVQALKAAQRRAKELGDEFGAA